MKFKGPVFPSYLNARLDTTKKMQWLHHCGTKAQIRNLKQKCRKILDSKEEEIILTGQRVLEAVKDDPNQGFASLHLIAAGIDVSEDTGVRWVDAMTYILDRFEDKQRAQATGTTHV